MKKITSKVDMYDDEYENIAMQADFIIDMIQKSRLNKSQKELLESAICVIHEIRLNETNY